MMFMSILSLPIDKYKMLYPERSPQNIHPKSLIQISLRSMNHHIGLQHEGQKNIQTSSSKVNDSGATISNQAKAQSSGFRIYNCY